MASEQAVMKILTLALVVALGLFQLSAFAKDGPIGLSLSQLSRGGLESIPMPPAHSVHGQPRLSGISADKMTLFEVVGNPNNVHLATVLVTLSSDTNATARGGRLLSQFMKNASPGWNDTQKWLIPSIRYALAHPDSEISMVMGSRRYELFYSKEMSNINLTVAHR